MGRPRILSIGCLYARVAIERRFPRNLECLQGFHLLEQRGAGRIRARRVRRCSHARWTTVPGVPEAVGRGRMAWWANTERSRPGSTQAAIRHLSLRAAKLCRFASEPLQPAGDMEDDHAVFMSLRCSEERDRCESPRGGQAFLDGLDAVPILTQDRNEVSRCRRPVASRRDRRCPLPGQGGGDSSRTELRSIAPRQSGADPHAGFQPRLFGAQGPDGVHLGLVCRSLFLEMADLPIRTPDRPMRNSRSQDAYRRGRGHGQEETETGADVFVAAPRLAGHPVVGQEILWRAACARPRCNNQDPDSIGGLPAPEPVAPAPESNPAPGRRFPRAAPARPRCPGEGRFST